jgi:hypothetical protein
MRWGSAGSIVWIFAGPLDQPGVHILMVVLGVLFILGGFLTPGIKGAFSNGPMRPITLAGRVLLILTGLLVTGVGLYRALE